VVELQERCRARVVAQLRVVHRTSQSEVARPVDAIPTHPPSAESLPFTCQIGDERHRSNRQRLPVHCCAAVSRGRLTGPQSCEALSTLRGAEPDYLPDTRQNGEHNDYA
jgi:hypothetical protein